MKRLLSTSILALSLAATLFAGPVAMAAEPVEVPVQPAPVAQKAIKDHYIITLKAGADARSVAGVAGIPRPKHVYGNALNGFAAQLNAGQLNALRRNPNVAAIEEDQVIEVDTTQSITPTTSQPWGLDRIDQRALPLSGSYTFDSVGSGVRAYVIDSGLQANHPEFEGRAINMFDAFGGNGSDCNSHGTHVAGTIGGKTFGVAKKALLRGVRVLGCDGSGSMSNVVAGVDFVRQHGIKPAVANMSLGGGRSDSLNAAVANLSDAGIYVVVSSGNSNTSACSNVSPAMVTKVMTVGASDIADRRMNISATVGSNFGSCVDLYAPGVSIKSASLNSGTTVKTGTSMAAPHVAGVAALFKAKHGEISQAELNTKLTSSATANAIIDNPSGTPNRLLFKSLL